MTVNELIDLLQDLPGDAEVRLALQPTYPLISKVSGVWFDEKEDDIKEVYIQEGSQIGYGSSIQHSEM